MTLLPLMRIFRLPSNTYGIGIYPSINYGTVWRWDNGFLRKPTIIHWHTPHCEDDVCDSPCGHY